MKKKILRGSSKLTRNDLSNNKEDEKCIRLSKNSNYCKTHSFKLYNSDMNNLNQILHSVNEFNNKRPVNYSNIIRGLIHIGAHMKPETLLKAIKESM